MTFIYFINCAMMRSCWLFSLTLVGLASACSSEPLPPEDPLAGVNVVGDDPSDVPLRDATKTELARFQEGDTLFDAVFREPDGLGPLYIRSACASCHAEASRGPGAVEKIALVARDGITPLADQDGLPYGHTVRPYMTAGAVSPILAPVGDLPVRRSTRLGPTVFGSGYLEAVDDAEILRMEAEQAGRSDGIHGWVNRVTYHSVANPVKDYHQHVEGETNLIGRFGFKARIATLDDFTADAFQGDMGITSPLRPNELSNPDGLTDDAHEGVDIEVGLVNAVADYMRLLEIPARVPPQGPGESLFTEVRCAVCHVPSLKTRADYPIAALAGMNAPVFTDFLLHDMGSRFADGLADEHATSRSFKTSPLIGVRHQQGLLHDGRARTVEEAILGHEDEGSEANDSIARFKALSAEERAALVAFVQSL
jgi:CxxC motif-containing protein (DUF1111 family)